MSRHGREARLLVQVVAATLRESSTGTPLGPRWWDLTLRCGHVVERRAAYRSRDRRRRAGQPVQRGRSEVRPAPRNARCDDCPRLP